MTFYNPFFPPFINFPRQVSTFSSNNVEKLPQEIEVKKNCKHNLGNTYNLFNETDTLIILAILFFLYKQDTKDVPLMLCLFLLLFD